MSITSYHALAVVGQAIFNAMVQQILHVLDLQGEKKI